MRIRHMDFVIIQEVFPVGIFSMDFWHSDLSDAVVCDCVCVEFYLFSFALKKNCMKLTRKSVAVWEKHDIVYT